MKIDSYHLDFSSQHSATSQHTLQESLRAWTGNQRPDFEAARSVAAAADPIISHAGRAALATEQALQNSALDSPGSDETEVITEALRETEKDPRLLLIRQMIKLLTGAEIQVFSASDLQASNVGSNDIARLDPGAEGRQNRPAGYGIEYERHESYSETEQTQFQAAGVIRTSDGKEINFQLNLQMQRSYHAESHVSLRMGDEPVRKDPLVINFNGAAAELHSQRFRFDLTGDGQQEQIALLGGNSGYLALDLNGNGQIDSGKELFGVKSGNGFADLAHHDDDGNGWIDENDAIYDHLRIWMPAAEGPGQLLSLQEKQVGALYLGSQATAFELRDAANQSLGGVRSSGIWFAENGQVGSLQQIDLSV
ncbi:MAG: hypothetical protein KUL75_06155 [Sterolibacterium sp.]|nr:hypothetical protein [Sterolibacterium sp.]